jgi:ribose transport system permease protein
LSTKAPEAQAHPPALRSFLQRLQENQMIMALIVAVVLFLIGGVFTTKFYSMMNIGNILALTVVLGFAGAGETLVVTSGGGIDLSIGAVMSLGAIMAAQTMDSNNANIAWALTQVVLMGLAVGLFNAAFVILTRVPAMVMTMATANVITAIQWLYTGGFTDGYAAPAILAIGSARLLPFLPYLVLIGIGMVLLIHFLLTRTVYGKQMFACGNNPHAAFLSGVRVKLVQSVAFMLAGLLNALAGWWFAAYSKYVMVEIANIYILPAIAAMVIGGTSMEGGKGSYTGTMIGALVLTLLATLLVLMKTDEAGRQIANGIVLIILLAAYNREPKIRQ